MYCNFKNISNLEVSEFPSLTHFELYYMNNNMEEDQKPILNNLASPNLKSFRAVSCKISIDRMFEKMTKL